MVIVVWWALNRISSQLKKFRSIMAAAAGVQTPKALYRHLLRKLQVLPAGARDHYKHRIRQVGHNIGHFAYNMITGMDNLR